MCKQMNTSDLFRFVSLSYDETGFKLKKKNCAHSMTEKKNKLVQWNWSNEFRSLILVVFIKFIWNGPSKEWKKKIITIEK